jgi:uncharacterized damage-inducible protein DinB
MTPISSDLLVAAYTTEACAQLAKATGIIRHCLQQLTAEQLAWRPHSSMNSIGNLVLHLCGNLRQWIIAGVGGAEDIRDRPQEFAEQGPFDRRDLLGKLDETVAEVETVLQSLTASQLLEQRRVQGFQTTGLSAIFDSIAHYKGHSQEIVSMTRTQLGDDYRFEWVPSTPEEGAP